MFNKFKWFLFGALLIIINLIAITTTNFIFGCVGLFFGIGALLIIIRDVIKS